jgi:hypothetical protein
MNTRDEKSWKEIKAEQEMTRRFQLEHPWHGIPPVYYRTFHLYLRWVLASIPLPKAEAEIPTPLHDTYSSEYQGFKEYFKRPPASASDVGAFLEEALGEQLEAALGREADANDYEYVADTLREETQNLPSVPLTVERAYNWLEEKATTLKKSVDNPVEEVEHSSTNESTNKAKPDDTATTELHHLASLSYRQIALFHIYEDKDLTSEFINQLLHYMGRTTPTSERQVLDEYYKIRPVKERENATGKILMALIKAVEKVIPHLSVAGKLRAEKELQLMKANKEKGL